MIISETNQKILSEKGIVFVQRADLILYKEIGKAGNSIPNWKGRPLITLNKQFETINEIYSDCPMLHLEKKADKYKLEHWSWVPGPGPGDFELEFDTESALIDFIDSYFFGENEYFEARKEYEHYSRDSINIAEVKSIFEACLDSLEKNFKQKEIDFFRRPFHKLPIEKFRSDSFLGEHPEIQVDLNFLTNEIRGLRKKIVKKQAYNAQDIRNVADLLMELSIQLDAE